MSFPRLHIAFITYKFGHQYGGAEAYGVELMQELAKRHDITVIAREYEPECNVKLPFIPIKLSDRWPSWIRTYLFARASAKLTQAEPYDLVHSHMNGWNGDVDVLHVKSVRYRWLSKPSVLRKLIDLLSPRVLMYLWLEKQRVHLRPPRRTVTVSELLTQQLQQSYRTSYPFNVITPGVHLPTLDPTVRQSTREQLGYKPNDIVCIQVARNPFNKGLSSILTALNNLPDNIKLVIVGASANLTTQLQQDIKTAPLLSRIQMVPQTPNIDAYYQAADLCLHPTFNDSFGMAPLEAMSYGLPVIMSSSQYCGFAHYVEHDSHALLLNNPHDAHELQQSINKLLANPNLADELRKKGLLLATTFSWENIAKRFESIYAEILALRIHKGKPNHLD